MVDMEIHTVVNGHGELSPMYLQGETKNDILYDLTNVRQGIMIALNISDPSDIAFYEVKREKLWV